jgi:hypothetical protein
LGKDLSSEIQTWLFQTYRRKLSHTADSGRSSINPPQKQFYDRHVIAELPSTVKKVRPQRKCVACARHQKGKDTIYCQNARLTFVMKIVSVHFTLN